MHHGHHCQYQDGIPAETVNRVGYLCGKIRSDDWRQNKERQKKSGNDQPRQTEVVNQFPDFRLLPQDLLYYLVFFPMLSPPLFNLADHEHTEFF